MASEIATVVNIQETITQRIRASFVELLPEEAFAKIVADEIKRFTTDKEQFYDNRNLQPSPLRQLIRAELQNRFKESLKIELSKPEYTPVWGNAGQEPGEVVKRIILESGAELWRAAVGNVVQEMVNRMRN
jgi:hypothetical protein